MNSFKKLQSFSIQLYPDSENIAYKISSQVFFKTFRKAF